MFRTALKPATKVVPGAAKALIVTGISNTKPAGASSTPRTGKLAVSASLELASAWEH